MFDRGRSPDRAHKEEDERRRHPRRPLTIPVTFQVINGRDPAKRSSPQEGLLKDISLGGLCFFTSEIAPDGLHISYNETPLERNLLLIRVALPPPYGPITVLAHCVWFQRGMSDSSSDFAVGVEFRKFKGNGLEVLQDYLKSRP